MADMDVQHRRIALDDGHVGVTGIYRQAFLLVARQEAARVDVIGQKLGSDELRA